MLWINVDVSFQRFKNMLLVKVLPYLPFHISSDMTCFFKLIAKTKVSIDALVLIESIIFYCVRLGNTLIWSFGIASGLA